MEFLLLVIAVWALAYGFTIENRRRKETAAARGRHDALERQVGALAHKLETLEARAQSAESAYPPAVAAARPQASAGVEHLCKKCGARLLPEAQYCTRCGSAVPTPIAPAQPEIKIFPQSEAAVTSLRSPSLVVPKSEAPAVQKPATPVEPLVAQSAPPAVKPAPVVPSPPVPVAPKSPPPTTVASASSPGTTTPVTPPVRPPLVQPPLVQPPRIPAPSVARVAAAAPAPKKAARSFEEVVGFKLLPIIGITAVILGVGFLVGASWSVFPHWLRVMILYLAGFVLLGGGISLERRQRYDRLGRALLGGGWAVMVLVTYAIANADSLKLLDSKNVDLFLLLAVIAAMVWHTLKYDSQVVTGVGFLLGFLAIGMNPSAPYNLIAGGMLIAGMTVIVLRHGWFELEVFGILASYANHFWWLYRVYEQQGQRAMFPYHTASVALVIGYWVIFRTSYLVRRISTQERESVSTFAGLLNPILFLLVMKYQGFHPEWAWKLLLAMGAVEFILGQLPLSRARRAPFQILSSLGAALMVASPLIRGSGNALEIIWLTGAEAFLLAGILTRERLFRYFGLIIAFLTALYAFPIRLMPLAQALADGKPHHSGANSLVLAVIAVVLYANAHVTRRRWPALFDKQVERLALSWLSFIASGFAVGAVYAYVGDSAVAIALALLVVGLSGAGKLFSISELIYEGHWIAILAFVQVIVADRDLTALWFGIPQRVVAFSAVSAMFYLSSRFVRLSQTANKSAFYAAYAWSATALLALLVWYQAPDWAVAVGWIGLAMSLTFAGHALNRNDLKWQGFALVLLAFVRALAVNFELTNRFHQFSYRLISVSAIAAGAYLLAKWAPLRRIRPVYTGLPTALLTYLVFKESALIWTAVFWIALALLLSAAAVWFKQADLKWQALILMLLSVARTFQVNFDVGGDFHGWSYRLISVGATALGIYLLARWAPIIEIRPIYSVAGTLLLAVVAFREAPAPWTAVAWVALALVLALAARWWKDRPLLWQTHLLSAMAAGWTLYANFQPEYRGSLKQLITVGITAAALYALNWLSDIAGIIEDPRICHAYAWAGSLLLSWLAWYQLDPVNVSLAWGVFALLLFEFQDFGQSWKSLVSPSAAANWRAQAYVALTGSFVHIFYANFNASGWGAAAYSVAPLVLIYFYLYWQLSRRKSTVFEDSIRVGDIIACLGTATLGALARFELQPDAVVIGYAGLVLATLLVAWLAGRQLFLLQALAMLAMAAFRIAMYNFYHLNDSFGSTLTNSVIAIALLGAAVPIAFQVRKLAMPARINPALAVLFRHPEQPLFFIPVALTAALLYIKFSGGTLTGAWGVEGFVVFVLALWAKERSFRLTGLSLMLLSACKLVYDTFYFDNPQVRYLTWIGVGIMILVVAFLYGKNREALRDYL